MRVQYRIAFLEAANAPTVARYICASVWIEGPPDVLGSNWSTSDQSKTSDPELTALVEGARVAIETRLGGPGVVKVIVRPYVEQWQPEYVFAGGELQLIDHDMPNNMDIPKMTAEVLRAMRSACKEGILPSDHVTLSPLRGGIDHVSITAFAHLKDRSTPPYHPTFTLTSRWVRTGNSPRADWCLRLRARLCFDDKTTDRWLTFDEAHAPNILYASIREAIDATVANCAYPSPYDPSRPLMSIDRLRQCTPRNYGARAYVASDWNCAPAPIECQVNPPRPDHVEVVTRTQSGDVVGYGVISPAPSSPDQATQKYRTNGILLAEDDPSAPPPPKTKLCEITSFIHATDPQATPEWIQDLRLPASPTQRAAVIQSAIRHRYWLKDAIQAYREYTQDLDDLVPMPPNNIPELEPSAQITLGLHLRPRHYYDPIQEPGLVITAIAPDGSVEPAGGFKKSRLWDYLQDWPMNRSSEVFDLDIEGLLVAETTTDSEWEGDK